MNVPALALFRDRAAVIFAAALVVLIALSLWWLVFFHRAITNEYEMMRHSLADAAHLHALRLRVARALPPAGVFETDKRFEVVSVSAVKHTPASATKEAKDVTLRSQDTAMAVIRAPWILRPRQATLTTLDAHYSGRRRMLLGEGTLLTGLLLSVVAMLYRLVRAERRFRDEMEQFLSRVTHEMKTPLAGIKAVLQVVESGRVPPDQVPILAAKALREVEREHQLIQNLLLAQRLRQPSVMVVNEPVDLGALLTDIIDHRRDLPGGADVHFDLQVHGQVLVLADPAALRSIVDNLLDNAVKYDGRTIEIVVEAVGKQALLRVQDDGMGFSPDVADALFTPFHRTKDAASGRQGTGLGLHITRTLARRMAGDVTAASTGVGQGAQFEVSLPLAHPLASI